MHALEKRLEDTERTLSRMATLVECTTIQNEYLNAMEAICVSTFEGNNDLIILITLIAFKCYVCFLLSLHYYSYIVIVQDN